MVEKVFVNLKENSYNIVIGDKLENIDSYIGKYSKILILTNKTVGKIYGETVKTALKSRDVFYYEIEDGEEYKNIDTALEVYDKLIEWEFTRDSLIISLGGGVVCDLTGYIAATYMRGIDFVQIPTSLLAQVDASVGGKVAINYKGKNLIGAFYQPKLVFIDHRVLNTLCNREIKTGIAETLKIALCFDKEYYEYLNENSQKFLSLDEEVVKKVITKACELKAKVVGIDEKENGIRALLNYGHSFGHVVECLTDYRVYTHGEGVVIGMNFANKLAEFLGITSKEYCDLCSELFEKYGLSYDIPKFDFERMLEVLKRDKKNRENKLKFVFSEELGKAHTESVSIEKIKEFYDSIDGNNVKAVIDMGTNTCRLFIAEVKNGNLKVPYLKRMEIVSLGEGVNESKVLKEEAINRTIKVLKEYKNLADQMGVTNIVTKATSATRDAENREYFINRALVEANIKIDCISGQDEGNYTFKGATLDIKDKIILIDIGGGSTEVIVGDFKGIEYIKSFNVGAIRIKEKFFENDDFITNFYTAKEWVLDEFKELKNLNIKDYKLVAVAGTATTQVTVRDEIKEYDSKLVHKVIVTKEDLVNNLKIYKDKSIEERKKIIGLHPKRAEFIIGGTYILEFLMELFNKDEFTVSENDILDGIMIED